MKLTHLPNRTLFSLEYALAFVILIGTVVFSVVSLHGFIFADWADPTTFIHFLQQALYIAIGIELGRLLLSYSLDTLVELLAFVIARKLLLLEDNFIGLALGILSLALLFGARHYFYRTFDELGQKDDQVGIVQE